MIPDLWRYRRDILPNTKYCWELQEKEFAGIHPEPPESVRSLMLGKSNVYVNNLAAIKYIERDEQRVYEVGSYAYRPQGRFGLVQYHFRLIPFGENKTAIYAHKELNPIIRPRKHLNSVGWEAKPGVEKAHQLFHLNEP